MSTRPTAGAAFFRLCEKAHTALHKGDAETRRILPELDALPLVQRALLPEKPDGS